MFALFLVCAMGETSITAVVEAFQTDWKAATKEYHDVSFTVTLGKRVEPPKEKPYYRVHGMNPVDSVRLYIPKLYRVGDEVLVRAKLKSGIWIKEVKKIVYDCEVIEELNVKPPLATPESVLAYYLTSPVKAVERYRGKSFTFRGTIQRIDGKELAMILTPPMPKRDAAGNVVKDKKGIEQMEIQRNLFSVSFADPEVISKFRLDKGTTIEFTATISEMRGGVIITAGAELTK